MKNKLILWILVLLFAVLMSLPWLVPHSGALALIGFIPLLIAEEIATQLKFKHFWWYHYSAFVLWNAFTTFWVCEATVGGGIFAVLANALQMSVIFALFRLGRRHLGKGLLPYVFLAVMWIAWERWYLQGAQISWPWLVLGNAFADSTRLVQWYEYTGTLGGSLWIWCVNIGIFNIISALADHDARLSGRAMGASLAAVTMVLLLPLAFSYRLYNNCGDCSEGTVDVLVTQPNFDPYEKFTALTQDRQTSVLLGLCEENVSRGGRPTLILGPETFTSDVIIAGDQFISPTVDTLQAFLRSRPGVGLLVGASSREVMASHSKPCEVAMPYGQGWWVSHNTAMMLGPVGTPEVYHKKKLVVGVELTPYPAIFAPLDEWLGKQFGVHHFMGRDVGQKDTRALHFGDIPIGCAVCYESVYGEHCADYVRDGAQAMTVITNDAWWGDTPGYRQHFNYSRLRAIELRREIARCGNTGISAFIDCKGDVVSRTSWWTRTTLAGSLGLSTGKTFFVRYGDVIGRACVYAFLLLAALLVVRALLKK